MEKASELEAVKGQLSACQEQKKQEETRHKEELNVLVFYSLLVLFISSVATPSTDLTLHLAVHPLLSTSSDVTS